MIIETESTDSAAMQVHDAENTVAVLPVDGATPPEAETKPEKTAHELRIEELEREHKKMQRGIDRRTRQLTETRFELEQVRGQRTESKPADDSEPLTLTRAELNELVNTQAAKLAPTVQSQAAEDARRQGIVRSIATTLGEQFDEISADLDDAFGGLMDRSGKPKPAIEAIFEADDPARVMKWLADPDNAKEAESVSRMSAAAAGKAIAKLEARLPTADKPAAKPAAKASTAPAPLESIRGQGAPGAAPDPSDTKKWMAWRNEQERKQGY